MDVRLPPSVDALPLHREKLEGLCAAAADDERIVGVVVVGSLATEEADVYSDIDVQIVVEDTSFEAALVDADRLIDHCGNAMTRYTGEHAGHPDMTVALYDDLVQVDLYFKRLSELRKEYRDNPYFVLWERGDRATTEIKAASGAALRIDVQWFEARIWAWCWYAQTKLLRGELYEAQAVLLYLRNVVLFPLLHVSRGRIPGGSRRAEQWVGDLAAQFEATAPGLDRDSLMNAVRTAVDLYVSLADPILEKEGAARNEAARDVVRAALAQGLDWKPVYEKRLAPSDIEVH